MSANEFILRSPLYRLTSEQRVAITSAQQRPGLRDLIKQFTFSARDLQDIQKLEERRLRKSPFLQRLKFTGKQTVVLKEIENQRAIQTLPSVANPAFNINADQFVNETRRSENLANQQYQEARRSAEMSLKITPAFIDTTKLLIHGELSPQTLITLRRKGLV